MEMKSNETYCGITHVLVKRNGSFVKLGIWKIGFFYYIFG